MVIVVVVSFFCDNGKDGEERDWCWGFVNFYFLGMKG